MWKIPILAHLIPVQYVRFVTYHAEHAQLQIKHYVILAMMGITYQGRNVYIVPQEHS
jgi:hypothetical protein